MSQYFVFQRLGHRQCRKSSVISATIALLFIVVYTLNPDRDAANLQLPTNEQPKIILIWNSHDRFMFKAFGYGQEAFVRNNCSVRDCKLIKRVGQVSTAEDIDAVVINAHHVYSSNDLPDFKRYAKQRYVLFTQEAAGLMPFSEKIARYANIFNWTMTYKHESDFPLLYGRVHSRQVSAKPLAAYDIATSRDLVKGKTRLVAWFSSHCDTPSKRELLVKKLQDYIPVDIYGTCGTLRCPKNMERFVSTPECYLMLEKTYKFYLSFENSLCQDYVTEKFFYILQLGVVPVVYGSADYEGIAPPHSYIDASKYTPRELADYLLLLDRNETLYMEYFRWKESFYVEAGVEQMTRYAFCDLCRKLHEVDESESTVLDEKYLVDNYGRSSQCEDHRTKMRRPSSDVE